MISLSFSREAWPKELRNCLKLVLNRMSYEEAASKRKWSISGGINQRIPIESNVILQNIKHGFDGIHTITELTADM